MSDVSVTCRNFKQLNPLARVMLELALKDIKAKGINPLVVETYRSRERQEYLYCQGRSFSECKNAGVSTTIASKYANPKAKKITWTLNSIHIKRNAVDVIPMIRSGINMIPIWDATNKDTKEIVKVMKSYGFEAGADWKKVDSPHFQISGVDSNNKFFSVANNNTFVTKVIQRKLNEKLCLKLVVDGIWGTKTTQAVNMFRKKNRWSRNGKLGALALKRLLSK